MLSLPIKKKQCSSQTKNCRNKKKLLKTISLKTNMIL